MGDRALIIFHDRSGNVSPVAYSHWGGEDCPKMLEAHKQIMEGRRNDVDYAFARFLGVNHVHLPGNLSLGAWNCPANIADAVVVASDPTADPEALALAEKELDKYSHGDAGVVLVDVTTYEWKAYGGYLSRYNHTTKMIEAA